MLLYIIVSSCFLFILDIANLYEKPCNSQKNDFHTKTFIFTQENFHD
jgi:hypothetical protein